MNHSAPVKASELGDALGACVEKHTRSLPALEPPPSRWLRLQLILTTAFGLRSGRDGSAAVPSPEQRPAEWGAAAAAAADAHKLAEPESVSVTTAHANERKLAAKNAQDASSKLFLAVMLRSHPALTTATVSDVGAKYLVAYLPEFGMEVCAVCCSRSTPREARVDVRGRFQEAQRRAART